MIENDCDHGNDLYHHFYFAEIAGFNGETLRGGNRAQSAVPAETIPRAQALAGPEDPARIPSAPVRPLAAAFFVR